MPSSKVKKHNVHFNVELDLSDVDHGISFSTVGDPGVSQTGVVITEIQKLSAADVDGRLRVGDVILMINNEVMYGNTGQYARYILDTAADNYKVTLTISNQRSHIDGKQILNDITSNVAMDSPTKPGIRRTGSISNKVLDDCITELDDWSTQLNWVSSVIYLVRDIQHGVGLQLTKTDPQTEYIISSIQENSPASRDGRLEVGDTVLAINGRHLTDCDDSDFDEMLKHNIVQLVVQKGSSQHQKDNDSDTVMTEESGEDIKSSSSDSQRNQATNATNVDIVPQTSMEYTEKAEILKKSAISENLIDEKMTIENDNEVQLKTTYPDGSSIYVNPRRTENNMKNIIHNSNKENDDYLTESDKQNVNHNQCEVNNVNIIKDKVEVKDGQEYSVLFHKKEGGKGLGFSIVGGADTHKGAIGVFVKTLYVNGLAAENGFIQSGDELLEVNQRPLKGLTHQQAVDTFKRLKSGPVLITAKRTQPRWRQDCNKDNHVCKTHLPKHLQNSNRSLWIDDGILIQDIKLYKDPVLGLGFELEKESGKTNTFIIGKITKGTSAALCKRISMDDEVLEVNNIPVSGRSLADGRRVIMDTAPGPVTLRTRRVLQQKQPDNEPVASSPEYIEQLSGSLLLENYLQRVHQQQHEGVDNLGLNDSSQNTDTQLEVIDHTEQCISVPIRGLSPTYDDYNKQQLLQQQNTATTDNCDWGVILPLPSEWANDCPSESGSNFTGRSKTTSSSNGGSPYKNSNSSSPYHGNKVSSKKQQQRDNRMVDIDDILIEFDPRREQQWIMQLQQQLLLSLQQQQQNKGVTAVSSTDCHDIVEKVDNYNTAHKNTSLCTDQQGTINQNNYSDETPDCINCSEISNHVECYHHINGVINSGSNEVNSFIVAGDNNGLNSETGVHDSKTNVSIHAPKVDKDSTSALNGGSGKETVTSTQTENTVVNKEVIKSLSDTIVGKSYSNEQSKISIQVKSENNHHVNALKGITKNRDKPLKMNKIHRMVSFENLDNADEEDETDKIVLEKSKLKRRLTKEDKIEILIIHRLPGEKLGMGISIESKGDESDFIRGVYVENITPGGAADRAVGGKHGVCTGDEILEINGTPMNEATYMETVNFFKELPLKIILKIKRRPLALRIASQKRKEKTYTRDESESETDYSQISQFNRGSDSGKDNKMFEHGRTSRYDHENRKCSATIPKGYVEVYTEFSKAPGEDLGLQLYEDHYMNHCKVKQASGSSHNLVHEGDILVQFNGISLEKLPVSKVKEILLNRTDIVSVLVWRQIYSTNNHQQANYRDGNETLKSVVLHNNKHYTGEQCEEDQFTTVETSVDKEDTIGQSDTNHIYTTNELTTTSVSDDRGRNVNNQQGYASIEGSLKEELCNNLGVIQVDALYPVILQEDYNHLFAKSHIRLAFENRSFRKKGRCQQDSILKGGVSNSAPSSPRREQGEQNINITGIGETSNSAHIVSDRSNGVNVCSETLFVDKSGHLVVYPVTTESGYCSLDKEKQAIVCDVLHSGYPLIHGTGPNTGVVNSSNCDKPDIHNNNNSVTMDTSDDQQYYDDAPPALPSSLPPGDRVPPPLPDSLPPLPQSLPPEILKPPPQFGGTGEILDQDVLDNSDLKQQDVLHLNNTSDIEDETYKHNTVNDEGTNEYHSEVELPPKVDHVTYPSNVDHVTYLCEDHVANMDHVMDTDEKSHVNGKENIAHQHSEPDRNSIIADVHPVDVETTYVYPISNFGEGEISITGDIAVICPPDMSSTDTMSKTDLISSVLESKVKQTLHDIEDNTNDSHNVYTDQGNSKHEINTAGNHPSSGSTNLITAESNSEVTHTTTATVTSRDISTDITVASSQVDESTVLTSLQEGRPEPLGRDGDKPTNIGSSQFIQNTQDDDDVGISNDNTSTNDSLSNAININLNTLSSDDDDNESYSGDGEIEINITTSKQCPEPNNSTTEIDSSLKSVTQAENSNLHATLLTLDETPGGEDGQLHRYSLSGESHVEVCSDGDEKTGSIDDLIEGETEGNVITTQTVLLPEQQQHNNNDVNITTQISHTSSPQPDNNSCNTISTMERDQRNNNMTDKCYNIYNVGSNSEVSTKYGSHNNTGIPDSGRLYGINSYNTSTTSAEEFRCNINGLMATETAPLKINQTTCIQGGSDEQFINNSYSVRAEDSHLESTYSSENHYSTSSVYSVNTTGIYDSSCGRDKTHQYSPGYASHNITAPKTQGHFNDRSNFVHSNPSTNYAPESALQENIKIDSRSTKSESVQKPPLPPKPKHLLSPKISSVPFFEESEQGGEGESSSNSTPRYDREKEDTANVIHGVLLTDHQQNQNIDDEDDMFSRHSFVKPPSSPNGRNDGVLPSRPKMILSSARPIAKDEDVSDDVKPLGQPWGVTLKSYAISENEDNISNPSAKDEMDKRTFTVEIHKEFGGLGVELATKDNVTMVTSIKPNGPVAENGKIRVGDVIVSVNNKPLTGLSIIRVHQMLRLLPAGIILLEVSRSDTHNNDCIDSPREYQPLSNKRDNIDIVLNHTTKPLAKPGPAVAPKPVKQVKREEDHASGSDIPNVITLQDRVSNPTNTTYQYQPTHTPLLNQSNKSIELATLDNTLPIGYKSDLTSLTSSAADDVDTTSSVSSCFSCDTDDVQNVNTDIRDSLRTPPDGTDEPDIVHDNTNINRNKPPAYISPVKPIVRVNSLSKKAPPSDTITHSLSVEVLDKPEKDMDIQSNHSEEPQYRVVRSNSLRSLKQESIIESVERKRKESLGSKLKGLQVPTAPRRPTSTSAIIADLPTIVKSQTNKGLLPKPKERKSSYSSLMPTALSSKPPTLIKSRSVSGPVKATYSLSQTTPEKSNLQPKSMLSSKMYNKSYDSSDIVSRSGRDASGDTSYNSLSNKTDYKGLHTQQSKHYLSKEANVDKPDTEYTENISAYQLNTDEDQVFNVDNDISVKSEKPVTDEKEALKERCSSPPLEVAPSLPQMSPPSPPVGQAPPLPLVETPPPPIRKAPAPPGGEDPPQTANIDTIPPVNSVCFTVSQSKDNINAEVTNTAIYAYEFGTGSSPVDIDTSNKTNLNDSNVTESSSVQSLDATETGSTGYGLSPRKWDNGSTQAYSPLAASKEDISEGRGSLVSTPDLDLDAPRSPTLSEADSGIFSSKLEQKKETGERLRIALDDSSSVLKAKTYSSDSLSRISPESQISPTYNKDSLPKNIPESQVSRGANRESHPKSSLDTSPTSNRQNVAERSSSQMSPPAYNKESLPKTKHIPESPKSPEANKHTHYLSSLNKTDNNKKESALSDTKKYSYKEDSSYSTSTTSISPRGSNYTDKYSSYTSDTTSSFKDNNLDYSDKTESKLSSRYKDLLSAPASKVNDIPSKSSTKSETDAVKDEKPTSGDTDTSKEGVMEVELYKGAIGLGFCIEGGKGSLKGDLPVSVKRLFKGSTSAHGKLEAGDEIMLINGEDISHMTHYMAWNHLKALPEGNFKLLLKRKSKN